MSSIAWLLQILLVSFGLSIGFMIIAVLASYIEGSRFYDATIARLRRVPWGPVLLVGIPLLVIGGCVVASVYPSYSAAWLQRRYAFLGPRLQEFLETARGDRSDPLIELPARSLMDVVSAPRIVAITASNEGGNPSLIQRQVDRIDPIMLVIPKEWQPRDPNEVNVVVACRWSSELRGTYSDSINGYVDRCRFSVYHMASGTLLFSGITEGEQLPPSIKRSRRSFGPSSNVYGGRADASVVEQIRQGFAAVRAECVSELQPSAVEQ